MGLSAHGSPPAPVRRLTTSEHSSANTAPDGNDPIASQTSWEPLVSGGANFRTRNLVQMSPERLEFPASMGMKLFGGLFAGLGLLALGLGIAGVVWIAMLVGGVFTVVGLWLLRSGTAPVVFDKRHDAFWKGRLAPFEARNRADIKDYADLGDIHALQLLAEHVSGDKSSYYSYELNLVLRNGTRLNVVDHGDYKALRAHAETLSRFLDRPVWDGTGTGR